MSDKLQVAVIRLGAVAVTTLLVYCMYWFKDNVTEPNYVEEISDNCLQSEKYEYLIEIDSLN